jgi:hypothetical protein
VLRSAVDSPGDRPVGLTHTVLRPTDSSVQRALASAEGLGRAGAEAGDGGGDPNRHGSSGLLRPLPYLVQSVKGGKVS